MTESRLDRLLKLIDTAQSPAYRRLAAKQLGALVQSQPNQARPLLKMLEGMIYSKNWDTRIACGFAIEYIFTALPAQFIEKLPTDCSTGQSELLKEMDLPTEIRSRKALLACAGSEFDIVLTISAAERLRINRVNVKATLGLDEIDGMEELERELVRDEDLTAGFGDKNKAKPAEPVIDLEKLSARERIAMKRKARLNSQASVSKQAKKSDESLSINNSTTSTSTTSNPNASESNLFLDNFESIESDALWFCERMRDKLLNPNWQVRHGALLGLRGVLGRGLPIISPGDSGIISESQEGWIDFLLCDILLVLGLDRFGDFVGDQVVSPVKETAAQLFSLIFKRLEGDKKTCLVDRHLKALMSFEQWQVRHAGILSLKYILSNNVDCGIIEIDSQICDRIMDLLSDGDEDVRSVAADVLSSLLSTGRQASVNLERIFAILQTLLKGLDELSPSVAPILDLLGHLVGLNVNFKVESSLLLPFIRQASTKVRRQVIRVLGAINVNDGEELCVVLTQLIQSMAIELDREINDLTLTLVLDLITISENLALDNKTIDNLFEIVSCPLGRPYSLNNFTFLTGPAGHDLAFKKSDMMLISEEEGVVQRMNVSRALKAVLEVIAYDSIKQRERLSKSQWCINHLVHFWIFGPSDCGVLPFVVGGVFNELASLSGSLQAEFNRFNQLISSKESNIVKSIEEFNTRAEKSVESLNQLTVLESVRSTFDAENAKYKARWACCYKGGVGNSRVWMDALRIETNARLQEFYAVELVKTIESDVESLDTSLLRELGEFMNLERIAGGSGQADDSGFNGVISAQRDWIELNCPGDTVWRAGRFIFKEISKSSVIVSKSVAITGNEEDLNWLILLLSNVKSKEIAEMVIEKISIRSTGLLQKKSSSSPFQVACNSLAFALLVRAEILVSAGAQFSRSLEQFLHELLFESEAQEVFPVILELMNRVMDGNVSGGNETILPIVPVFLKRTLMEINDFDGMIRKLASLTFSQLVKIAPLAGGIRSVKMSAETEKLIAQCREFLDQLQGPATALPDFIPPCKLNVEMRPYQQAGLNWLAFLRRFNLHGALCDDMGLGKTLQTLSIIASDHYEHQQKGPAESKSLRSLIVCPASLTGHWEAEVRQYCPTLESPLLYVGPSAQRHQNLLKRLSNSEIVITSYDVLRSDSEHFTGIQWNYCVLDEGHLIKNPKTKLSSAVRGLKAKRRLLLSGTPIQNNLLELWALFDFLLPGYLGNEKEFTEKYAKPILILQHQQSTSTNCDGPIGKWTQKDFDEAESKLQSLHKQVLPFILRRMKEDVLADLPPKIIQDYKCPMSSIQRLLYEDLMKGTGVKSEVSKFVHEKFKEDVSGGEYEEQDGLSGDGGGSGAVTKQTHVFQLLQQLRKLCVHPSLLLTPDHPLLPEVNSELSKTNAKMTDLSVAPKFQMLKELLVDCGLGDGEDNGNGTSSTRNSDHRVLIFAQHKSTLDLIENLVFKAHLPTLSYLRLDGSVEASSRYPIVSKFNTDMTIDVLLLTTHVGGLGLNLTTADTVIFMDPDWNPMKDLQAMDRAHRLGQKKVVTVYRLLLQDTLEDRIMSLQRWKTRIAGTVITQQNSEAVNYENILDLFEDDATQDDEEGESKRQPQSSSAKKTKKLKMSTGKPDWHNEDDSDLAAREAEYEREFK